MQEVIVIVAIVSPESTIGGTGLWSENSNFSKCMGLEETEVWQCYRSVGDEKRSISRMLPRISEPSRPIEAASASGRDRESFGITTWTTKSPCITGSIAIPKKEHSKLEHDGQFLRMGEQPLSPEEIGKAFPHIPDRFVDLDDSLGPFILRGKSKQSGE